MTTDEALARLVEAVIRGVKTRVTTVDGTPRWALVMPNETAVDAVISAVADAKVAAGS